MDLDPDRGMPKNISTLRIRIRNTATTFPVSVSFFNMQRKVLHCWTTGVPWGDDAALVEPAGEIDDNLASPVVVHHLELPDVSVLHHHGQESHHNLRAGPQQHLTVKIHNYVNNRAKDFLKCRLSIVMDSDSQRFDCPKNRFRIGNADPDPAA
jgi:hypothetical protein